MADPNDKPLRIETGKPVRPRCPRCGSEYIVIGRLSDASGSAVQFTAILRGGSEIPSGFVRSCYCNDCGEITLTLG